MRDKLLIKSDIDCINRQIDELTKKKRELTDELNQIHNNKRIDQFLRSYNGQQLLKSHKLTEEGEWNVYGEDANCDMGGHHHTPHLGVVVGDLEKVIEWAVTQNNFWTWGYGGEIKKVVTVDVKKIIL